ncbi:hypothetical protein [Hydrogenophaga taeniospiralis]|uniref:hypothetical protein n=1 Tax=Hydrogenophaga taeniospiralis TaxID=65656 RepID=UPI001CF9694D|nr:hypothetical protein [Hydrogenophaga taeniospiralis]UCU95800.1 hypothetical protein KI616_08145 [Hydrogenophaga taeniospiralis]
MRTITILIALAASLLAGCATPIPLNTLRYEQPMKVSSTKEATVVVVSGAVRGAAGSYLMPVGGIFIPMSSGPNPMLQFNAVDQQAFAESLRAELVRNGVLRVAAPDTAMARDLKVQVIFAQTYHNPNFQEYVLDVVAEMTGGKEPALRQYRVVSSEKDSTWEKWNTNAYQGKAKAARLLLEKLIPDIASYVAAP